MWIKELRVRAPVRSDVTTQEEEDQISQERASVMNPSVRCSLHGRSSLDLYIGLRIGFISNPDYVIPYGTLVHPRQRGSTQTFGD